MNFVFYHLSLAVLLCSQALAAERSCPLEPQNLTFVPWNAILILDKNKVADDLKRYQQGDDDQQGYYYKDKQGALVLCFDKGKSPFKTPLPVLTMAEEVNKKKYILIDGYDASFIATVEALKKIDRSITNTLTVPVNIDILMR